WEALRPFFLSKGYDLYTSRGSRGLFPRINDSPALDSFGLYGDRSNFVPVYTPCSICHYSPKTYRKNRDVVIKPVSWGSEETQELRILRYLNSDPIRANPANATVPVIDILEHSAWTFAVMPFWGDCDRPEFATAGEALEWASQLIGDISHENVQMNFYGTIPPDTERPAFRSDFPVKYALIDFGSSVQFPPDTLAQERRGYWVVGREQRAPETKRKRPFDPFAADVYQTGRTIYGWIKVKFLTTHILLQGFVDQVPSLLGLLQDMTRARARNRMSAPEAHERILAIQASTPESVKLQRLTDKRLGCYDEVVPGRTAAYIYGTSPY
ncbi:hypothetical protein GLOTRDRAFT_42983, partial [Gloeophyllum trabeum ATCC 11539]